MVVRVKDLKAMTAPKLRKLAVVYGIPKPFLLPKSEVFRKLLPFVRRDAAASAYLQRARTYWR
jgi:hypothetical protein